jgi:hypothetical protein
MAQRSLAATPDLMIRLSGPRKKCARWADQFYLDLELAKGASPVIESTQLGSRMVAPIAPQGEHRGLIRSTSLLACPPWRAIASASFGGALWWQSRASQ